MSKVELYYFPTSFYSQKARLSLEEKGIKYKRKLVSLKDNEQNQPFFLRINPKGEVPTLRIGDEIVAESERIIDRVDCLPSDCPSKLVLDHSTASGQLVREWREKINAINVGQLTYGVLMDPELSKGSPIPASLRMTREGTRLRFETAIKEMEEKKQKEPKLKDALDVKIKQYQERLINFFDQDKVMQILKETEPVIEEIEQQLKKMSAEHKDQGWLCGQAFTAADIGLTVLLGRFSLLGLLTKFADAETHPALANYWQRVQMRPSVQKVVLNSLVETKRFFAGRAIRKYGGLTIAVGAAAFAVWLGFKHLKK